jgi:hypothetical protein
MFTSIRSILPHPAVIFGRSFGFFRVVLIVFPALAQMYLFLRARKAILSSRGSDRFKSGAVGAVGLVLCLCFGLNGYILLRPLVWLDAPVAARIFLFYLPSVWALASVFSGLLLCLVHVAAGLARAVGRLFNGRAGKEAPLPADPLRRRFLQAGAAGLVAAPFVLSAYGAAYGSERCEVRDLSLPFGRSLRVVQLSDIHAGPYMTRGEIRRYVDRVMALRPDLFVLTGDFISNSMAFFPGCMEELTRVRARYGTFAILGNHERWYGRPGELRRVFHQYGVPLLVNSHRVIGTAEGPFAVAGIDDLATGHPDLESALRGLDPSIPTLLLSHRPEIFPRAAAYGIALTLAGHYHGGQIKVILGGVPISLAHLRTPYPEGLYRIGGSSLYVSRGIGTTFTPVRLNAPPEITVFHLTGSAPQPPRARYGRA